MSGQWHPDTEAIASFRAGLIDGFRGRRLAAHIAGCARCTAVGDQLGAVSSVLASVSAPALPEAFERQISAAIAAEATAREPAASPAQAQASPDHPPRRARPRPARSRNVPSVPGVRGLRLRPALAFVPVVACLLAGLGYLASDLSGSTSPSVAEGPDTSGPAMAAASSSASSAPFRAEAKSPGIGAAGAVPTAVPSASAASSAFEVIQSGTRYQASTLRAQVRAEVATTNTTLHGLGTQAASSGSDAVVPSSPLIGCVLSVTGGVGPIFVDKASYQGKSAYVIVVSDRAWVVGLGCTASNHELITSTSLTATP